MKQLRFILAALLLMVCGTIAHAQKVVVYKSDGTKVEYNASDVKEVKYETVYGYYGLIDEQYDDSFIKTSTFTNSISKKGEISITPINKKRVAVLTLDNHKPAFTYKTGGVQCVGEITKGSDWGGNDTLCMNGKTYYVWAIYDVMDASWTDVILTIN